MTGPGDGQASSLIDRLRRRKIVQWALAYLAGAWLALEVLDLLAKNFSFPPLVAQAALVLLAVGFLAALVVGWFQGEKGEQRTTTVEILMLAALALLAAAAVALVGRDGSAPGPAASAVEPASAAPPAASLVVLPFQNVGADPENEYFSDGLTEELINDNYFCRSRPPVATSRLSRQSDGRLLYRLKQRWRDGTTHVVFEPHELMERLAALVPRPRAHLVRYHGILGPCASDRDCVVPAEPAPRIRGTGPSCPGPPPRASDRAAVPSASASAAGTHTDPGNTARASPPSHAAAAGAPIAGARGEDHLNTAARRARRLSWAQLAQRVFAFDVLVCPKCSGPMRIIATIHPPDATRAILACLGLPARGPPLTPARRVEDDALWQAQPESDFFA